MGWRDEMCTPGWWSGRKRRLCDLVGRDSGEGGDRGRRKGPAPVTLSRRFRGVEEGNEDSLDDDDDGLPLSDHVKVSLVLAALPRSTCQKVNWGIDVANERGRKRASSAFQANFFVVFY